MSMTTESKKDLEPEARRLRRELFDDELLDKLLAATSERGLALTGEGGFLPEMIKAVLERGMEAELTDHLGYDKHDPAGRGSGNSRNGSTPKTLGTEVEISRSISRGIGTRRSARRWCPRGCAASAGWRR